MEQKTRAQIIKELSEKYNCSIHVTPCFIINTKHLQLNPFRLQLWAKEIVSINKYIFINNINNITNFTFITD